MMKKSFVLGVVVLASVLTLAGCGKKNDEDLTDKLKEQISSVEKPEETADAVSEEAPAEEMPEEDTDDGLQILLHRESVYQWGEGSLPRIRHKFGYPELEEKYAKHHPELAANFEKIRDAIISDERENWNDSLEKVKSSDYDGFYFEQYWNTFVRRADKDITSLVVECRKPSGFEHDYYSYKTYNYDTERGKEITLADVAADESALLDRVAQRAAEYVDDFPTEGWGDEAKADAKQIRADLPDYLSEGNCCFSIDPQGINFYFDSDLFFPSPVSATVLFAEEPALFREGFVESAPEEWIMQSPGAIKSLVDLNDTGEAVYVRGDELFDYDVETDDFYLCGLYANCGSKYTSFKTTMKGGTDYLDIFLVHRDHHTILMENHYEYDTAFLNTYMLYRDDVEPVSSIQARLESAEAASVPAVDGGEAYTDYYIPTDADEVRAFAAATDAPEQWMNTKLCVDGNGAVTSDDVKIEPANDQPAKEGQILKEEDIPSIADGEIGTIGAYVYRDFDGDGLYEAFVANGRYDGDDFEMSSVWFISSDAKVTKLRDDFQDFYLYQDDNGYYREYKAANRGFFCGDCGAYGSGWLTFIFSVKDGKPYELDLSMKTEGFYQDSAGDFYTLTDNFDDGHKYLITELHYDSATGQFEKGTVTDKNWANW